MKQEVVNVFFAVAIIPSVILLLASDHTHGLAISVESEESSPSCCSGDCHNSEVRQSNEVVTNEDKQFSLNSFGSKTLNSSSNFTCTSTWLIPSNATCTGCECGSLLNNIVRCNSTTGNVALLKCYVMTFSVEGSDMLVVGRSPYGCVSYPHYDSYYPLNSNSSKLNEVCSKYHRKGQLCSNCEEEFALPVYSYSLSCVKCRNHSAINWIKYLAVSLLPLTLFFITIMACRVRVTSGQMNAFILLSQMASFPVTTTYIFSLDKFRSTLMPLYAVAFTYYSMWNLDFFRALYHPFCLNPETTTLQILALDYIIAVYPLVLLVVVYMLVKLYDSNCKVLVYLWRPFHRCFEHFRRDWNIKTSLIDSFATFLLLSYVKFLSVSFQILTPVRLSNIHGKELTKQYLYLDGTTEFFGSKHLPYAILALTVLINVLPLLLLCLYPCRWFQKCLNHCNFQNQILHIFMDAFQGCYKNGTNGNYDCRWFAGLYLFLRILLIAILALTLSEFLIPLLGCTIVVLIVLTAVIQPYKASIHNRINIFFLLVIVFTFISLMARGIVLSQAGQFKTLTNGMIASSLFIPLIFSVGVSLYKLLAHWMCVQTLYRKLCRICIKLQDEDFESLLPERMVNVEECAVLSADSKEASA